ncbi:MAG: hypothetical protein AAF411_23210, partial [Myxococcota bacterium]
PAAQTNRTMLGVAMTDASAGEAPSDESLPDIVYSRVQPPKKGRRYALYAFLLVCLLLTTFGIVTLVLRGPNVSASVVPGGEGERLRVEVPDAAPGTKVRFQGEEQALEGGRAEFAIAADALHIGENELTVSVVDPDGAAHSVPLRLDLDYRVRADLSPLTGDTPKLRILVDAKPGSTVTLDETPVALDGSGHAAVDFDVEPSASVLERSFRYRVVTDGAEAAAGEVAVRVPIAALQVTRPATGAVTDRELLTVTGAVHDSATVTVDGETATVTAGRFSIERPLPSVGEHTVVVVARREGRVPRRIELQVSRVDDLRAAAAGFGADRRMTYARLAADPDSHQGKRVSFVGRVFNVGTSPDGPMLQMVSRDCRRGARCPIWVNYDGATPVEMNQMVRVYGEASGEQQYRTSDGSVGRSPKVRAAFVLPEGR